MKKMLVCLLFSGCITPGFARPAAEPDLKLWYEKPASVWEESLLIGNGRIGAAVFGEPIREVFQLNEETLWSGYPKEETNPKAFAALPEIRRAVDEGNYQRADKLWKENSQGPYSARYLPMADLTLEMTGGDGTPIRYYRDLNLSDATATVRYEIGGVGYTRTAFVSYPDQVMVVRIEADRRGAVSFDAALTSALRFTATAQGHTATLTGRAPSYVAHRKEDPRQVVYDDPAGEGMRFEVRLEVRTERGSVTGKEGRVSVRGADAATLILAAATSYNGFDQSPGLAGKDPSKSVKSHLDKASGKPYGQLKQRHIQDYKNLFDRVSISLGARATEKDAWPTDRRLLNYPNDDSDMGLIELYYQLGRYLTIASSRPGGVPANLQGIWNYHVQPPWGSNYTTNINTQMNYWPAESSGLAECHEPLFAFIRSLSVRGSEVARVNYGIDRGWVAHHNSDVWAQAAPSGNFDKDLTRSRPAWSCWNMSGAWFCRHLWEHYLYGGDRAFLSQTAYPLMKGAAEFFLQYLVEDPRTGYLVTNPSTSPENNFLYLTPAGKKLSADISKASTMDLTILWDLFTNCIRASETLGIDEAFRQRLADARSRLYPLQAGSRGNLQEWYRDFEERDPKHRHISHLYGLFPGRQVIPRENPELAAACKRSLQLRGLGGMGWSMVWKVACLARLEEGDLAFQALKNALKYEPSTKPSVTAGGSYINLLNAAPFQIDANFGGTAAITEMLVQSYGGEIFVLPALPEQWAEGAIKGIRCRGGFTVDLEWKDGRVTKVGVHSALGGNCRIRSRTALVSSDARLADAQGRNPNPYYFTDGGTKIVIAKNAQPLPPLNLPETRLVDFDTRPGGYYELRPGR